MAPGRLLASRLNYLLGLWDRKGFWQNCQGAGRQRAETAGDAQSCCLPDTLSTYSSVRLQLGINEPNPVSRSSSRS